MWWKLKYPYVQLCVPNKVKNMNVKVFNLISRVNKTRFLIHHELCECNVDWLKEHVTQTKNGDMWKK